MNTTAAQLAGFETAGDQILWTKYGFVTTFALLVYDHILTFPEELEYVWRRNFTAATWLFFLNRYYAIFAIGIGLLEDISPAFNPKICARMILFQPVAVGIPLTIIPNLIIILRIYALFQRNKTIAMTLFLYCLAELGVALWIYLTPSVKQISLFPGDPNSSALHTCLAQVSPSLTNLQTASFQIMQSIYNSIALALILFKTANGRGIVAVIAKQGLIYYVVNFSMVTGWTMMLLFATPGIKYTLAGPALGFASLSTAKLTLHLRSYGIPKSEVEEVRFDHQLSYRFERRRSWVGTTTFDVSDSDMGADGEEAPMSPTYELTVKDLPRIVRTNIPAGVDFRVNRK